MWGFFFFPAEFSTLKRGKTVEKKQKWGFTGPPGPPFQLGSGAGGQFKKAAEFYLLKALLDYRARHTGGKKWMKPPDMLLINSHSGDHKDLLVRLLSLHATTWHMYPGRLIPPSAAFSSLQRQMAVRVRARFMKGQKANIPQAKIEHRYQRLYGETLCLYLHLVWVTDLWTKTFMRFKKDELDW